MKERN
jgi:hypothetical protein